MNTNTLSFACEFKALTEADGSFEGYAAVFENIDNGMDVLTRGAFQKSLDAGYKVKMLWQHDPNHVIGVWDEIKEDERGLYVKGRILSDVSKGREALALLRNGALDSMSIGYRTKVATQEGNGTVRRLVEVDLKEISIVTFPMNELAMVTAVKSDELTTIREFEAGLRDAGFSRKEAKAIAADGFKGFAACRDDVVVEEAKEDASLVEAVQSLNTLLERMKHV